VDGGVGASAERVVRSPRLGSVTGNSIEVSSFTEAKVAGDEVNAGGLSGALTVCRSPISTFCSPGEERRRVCERPALWTQTKSTVGTEVDITSPRWSLVGSATG
jgi:hypothetical protein